MYSSRRIRAARANGARSRGPRTPVDRIANFFDGLAQSPAIGLMHRHETRLRLRAALPSPPEVVELVPEPNPGIPNEPSPISGRLPDGDVPA